jgi:hypothetical protein
MAVNKANTCCFGRDGRQIPIEYVARVFPDGCMVARWEPKKDRAQKLAS